MPPNIEFKGKFRLNYFTIFHTEKGIAVLTAKMANISLFII